ncbi:MAG: 4-alpha-glucanotransferase [Clostridia bacterium]|nr:4-alpha-glucanotransferase [Clostridia bacterium]
METRKDRKERKTKRRAGVLMPVSSLPSAFGIGTLGEGAYAFVDWMREAGIKVWQVLPLVPTGFGDSPYQSCCSDALNYYFIDLDLLEKDGLLAKAEYESFVWSDDERRVDYGRLYQYRTGILRKAFERFDRSSPDWRQFIDEKRYEDYAVFMTLKERFGYRPWRDWDEPYKTYDESVATSVVSEAENEVRFWQFTQFVFLKQWRALRQYATERGIAVMGDMPIYVADDSVETWKHGKELFMVDEKGNLSMRAGVPPDAFSEDGQFWGNPVYDWEKMEADGYAWWKARFQSVFSLYDIVRIDHFRAFDRFYAIPNGAETAKEGEWLDGPKEKLFDGCDSYEIVAEDLGIIDDGVRALLNNTGFPGMKVFVFAFDHNPENEYLPTHYNENCVAYTGTHDNETLRYFIENMDADERKCFEKELEDQCLALETPYLTETMDAECESVIELLFASKANLIVIPMHDVLCMGEEARLNAPSTVSGANWTFRFILRDFKKRKAAWLKRLTEEYDR